MVKDATLGDNQGTFREHSGNIQGTFEDNQVTFRRN
jgi:hypothetical protein